MSKKTKARAAARAVKAEQKTPSRSLRVPASLWVAAGIAFFFAAALFIRAYYPYHQIFSDAGFKLSDPDSYYHLRLVENLLGNHFHRIGFDPYTYFPHGSTVTWPPLFDWLLGAVIWLIGRGSPGQSTINVVSAYYPAVLGSLIIIPTYFIGKALFNRPAGLIAAGLVAVMPSGLLLRSRLGNLDHHVAESLFVALVILFLVLALQAAENGAFSFQSVKNRSWQVIWRPLLYSVLAGFSIGAYLLTWVGGLFFVFFLFLFFVVLSVINHLRGTSTEPWAFVGSAAMLVGTLIALPFLPGLGPKILVLMAFAVASLAPLALAVVSNWMNRRGMKKALYPLILLAIGVCGVLLVYFVSPSLLGDALDQFGLIWRSGAALSIGEVLSILSINGRFSLSLVWAYFTTGIILSLAAVVILTRSALKRPRADIILLLTWTLFMMVATITQRRFAYYFAVNVAVLSGYVTWLLLEGSAFRKTGDELVVPKNKSNQPDSGLVFKVVSLGVAFIIVFLPDISPAINLAGSGANIENDIWYNALVWLNENSPEPFGDAGYYYLDYTAPPSGQDYVYPDSAYSVMAPWQKGHEITAISRRIPVANPFQQGAREAAEYFGNQDETSAARLMDELGVRYVMLDRELTTSLFESTIAYSDYKADDYFEIYYQVQDGKLTPVYFFYPPYYYSMAARLFYFGGLEIKAGECQVVSYEEVSSGGSTYKRILELKTFPSYEAANAFVAAQQSGNYRIGNTDPTKSPVALGKLDGYKMVYFKLSGGQTELKIFEYTP